MLIDLVSSIKLLQDICPQIIQLNFINFIFLIYKITIFDYMNSKFFCPKKHKQTNIPKYVITIFHTGIIVVFNMMAAEGLENIRYLVYGEDWRRKEFPGRQDWYHFEEWEWKIFFSFFYFSVETAFNAKIFEVKFSSMIFRFELWLWLNLLLLLK